MAKKMPWGKGVADDKCVRSLFQGIILFVGSLLFFYSKVVFTNSTERANPIFGQVLE